MRFFSSITAAGMLVLLLPGCGVLKLGGKKKVADKPAPQSGAMALVGIVEMVNPEQRYVLIRCEVSPNLPAGTELIALDASGAQSKLVLTPERKGLYLTADVKDGSPKVTNLVMLRRGAPAQTTAAPPPPAQAPAAVPSVPLTNPFPQSAPAPAAPLPLEPPLPKQPAPAPPP